MKQSLKLIPNITGGGSVKTTGRKLTEKQRVFVDEYLISLNAADAARKAGYSPRTAKDIGCENLAKPNIAAAIQEKMKDRSAKTEIKADDVLLDLREVSDICMGRKSVIIEKSGCDEAGNPYIKKMETTTFNAASAIRALETIGRHLGMFDSSDKEQDVHELFFASVRAFITQEAPLPRDR